MEKLRTAYYDSLEQLRRCAAAWDDLWRRSSSTRPVARAATVAQWIEHFAPAARFRAVVVQRGERLAAALPLIGQRVGGVIEAGCLPHNAWSPAGDLLLDPSCDAGAVLRRLVEAVRDLPWQLLWLDGVPYQAAPWSAFHVAVAAVGLPHLCRWRFDTGVIELDGDGASNRDAWSRNHRRKMAQALRRLRRTGELELEWHEQIDPADVEHLLRRGFAIEDSGWKGRAGTSVLRAKGMFEFFLAQARLLAAEGQLRVALLNRAGRSIAFEYALAAKSTYHALKVGYDERFARHSPGQLLTHEVLARLSNGPGDQHYDCMGPLTDALRKWKPRPWSLGRIVVAPHLLGRLALHAYKHWWPGRRRDEARSGQKNCRGQL